MKNILLLKRFDPREWIWVRYKKVRLKAWALKNRISMQRARVSEALESYIQVYVPGGQSDILASVPRGHARQMQHDISLDVSNYQQLTWTAHFLRLVYFRLHLH